MLTVYHIAGNKKKKRKINFLGFRTGVRFFMVIKKIKDRCYASALYLLVDLRGVEPLSENLSAIISPITVCYCAEAVPLPVCKQTREQVW